MLWVAKYPALMLAAGSHVALDETRQWLSAPGPLPVDRVKWYHLTRARIFVSFLAQELSRCHFLVQPFLTERRLCG